MERPDERMAMSIREHAAEWFLRLHARDLSVHERFAYLEWLKTSPVHIGETLQICRLYSLLYPMKKQLYFMNEDSLSNVIELPQRDSAAAPDANKARWHVRLAAAVVLATVALFAVIAQRAWFDRTIETQASEWRSLTLTDGSVVNVGPRTHLRDRFDGEQRLLRLSEGEALFQVAKDPSRPFIVDAQLATVRATGTRFGVSHRGPEVIITVAEGTVLVSHRSEGSASIALSAGDQLVVANEWPVPVTHVSVEHDLAWANRRLIFNNHTVLDAVEEFNRRNRLQIVVAPELRAAEVQGSFRADDPLSFVEGTAVAIHGIVVRESPDVVRLDAQGRD